MRPPLQSAVVEDWREIPGYPGYEASTLGRVRSVARLVLIQPSAYRPSYMRRFPGVVLKPWTLHGYAYVSLGEGNHVAVCRAVCLAFNGLPPDGKPDALHWDGYQTNDRPGNLRWGSHYDNAQDARRHGTILRGEKNHRAKLTNAQAAEIKRRLAAGERGVDLAAEFGVSKMTISGIKHGTVWA